MYFACRTSANIPAAIGVAAEVPVKSHGQEFPVPVVH